MKLCIQLEKLNCENPYTDLPSAKYKTLENYHVYGMLCNTFITIVTILVD